MASVKRYVECHTGVVSCKPCVKHQAGSNTKMPQNYTRLDEPCWNLYPIMHPSCTFLHLVALGDSMAQPTLERHAATRSATSLSEMLRDVHKAHAARVGRPGFFVRQSAVGLSAGHHGGACKQLRDEDGGSGMRAAQIGKSNWSCQRAGEGDLEAWLFQLVREGLAELTRPFCWQRLPPRLVSVLEALWSASASAWCCHRQWCRHQWLRVGCIIAHQP